MATSSASDDLLQDSFETPAPSIPYEGLSATERRRQYTFPSVSSMRFQLDGTGLIQPHRSMTWLLSDHHSSHRNLRGRAGESFWNPTNRQSDTKVQFCSRGRSGITGP
jgi:hypothetical protein